MKKSSLLVGRRWANHHQVRSILFSAPLPGQHMNSCDGAHFISSVVPACDKSGVKLSELNGRCVCVWQRITLIAQTTLIALLILILLPNRLALVTPETSRWRYHVLRTAGVCAAAAYVYVWRENTNPNKPNNPKLTQSCLITRSKRNTSSNKSPDNRRWSIAN